jgi:hypothetical protein
MTLYEFCEMQAALKKPGMEGRPYRVGQGEGNWIVKGFSA